MKATFTKTEVGQEVTCHKTGVKVTSSQKHHNATCRDVKRLFGCTIVANDVKLDKRVVTEVNAKRDDIESADVHS